jgi:hypothetical protein
MWLVEIFKLYHSNVAVWAITICGFVIYSTRKIYQNIIPGSERRFLYRIKRKFFLLVAYDLILALFIYFTAVVCGHYACTLNDVNYAWRSLIAYILLFVFWLLELLQILTLKEKSLIILLKKLQTGNY